MNTNSTVLTLPAPVMYAVADSPSFVPLCLLEAAEVVLRMGSREALEVVAASKGKHGNTESRAKAKKDCALADKLVKAIAQRSKVLAGNGVRDAGSWARWNGDLEDAQEAVRVAEAALRTALAIEAMGDLTEDQWLFEGARQSSGRCFGNLRSAHFGTRAGTAVYVYPMTHESEANRQSRFLKTSRYLGLSYAEGGRPLPGASLRSRYTRGWPLPLSPRLDQDLDELRAQVEALERRLNGL